MSDTGIPPMEPLAPIVDHMRDLAREELPAPRTCRVSLWDDDTFDVVIYHSMGEGERQQLRYGRTTGEILWEYYDGADWESEDLSGGETLHTRVFDEVDVRILDAIEPPYSDSG